LVHREEVVEAQHPFGVIDRGESGDLRRADRLRGRVLALQLGVQALELFEPAHPAVVGRVIDERGVATVVGVLRLEDAGRQFLRLDTGVFQRDVLRHPASLRAGADIGRRVDAVPQDRISAGHRAAQASTGTADTVVSMVNWPSTRVPTYSTAL